MKKSFVFYALMFVLTMFFTACNENEPEDLFPDELVEGCYVVNYGNFGKGGASISKYDYNTGEVTNFYYQQQNGGNELLSNIQYACSHNDSVYLIGNAPDGLITLNPLMVQARNAYAGQLNNPRFCVASGNYLYISCWGANPDYAEMPGSYIAKYNLETLEVDARIDVPGGPEGLAVANGKLFAALNYKKAVAVVDLSNQSVTEIALPAAASYFVKDNLENLYVTLVSTFTLFSEETGIGYIDTKSNQFEKFYALGNVSSSYGSVMQASTDFSKIFVVTASYDANWNLTGAVARFDVASGKFADEPLVRDIAGISGLSVNPVNNDIYVFSATTATGAGKMLVYTENGDFVDEFGVGAFPVGAFYLP